VQVGDLVQTIAGNRAIILEVYPKQENEFSQHYKICFLKTGVIYDGYNKLWLLRVLSENKKSS
jgi:hypothetical protein